MEINAVAQTRLRFDQLESWTVFSFLFLVDHVDEVHDSFLYIQIKYQNFRIDVVVIQFDVIRKNKLSLSFEVACPAYDDLTYFPLKLARYFNSTTPMLNLPESLSKLHCAQPS